MCGNATRLLEREIFFRQVYCVCFFFECFCHVLSKNRMRAINNRDGSAGRQVLFGAGGASRGRGGKQVELLLLLTFKIREVEFTRIAYLSVQ